MTYLEDERADRIYTALKEKWGAEKLLSNLIGIMSDDLFRMYMEELGEGEVSVDKRKSEDEDEDEDEEDD